MGGATQEPSTKEEMPENKFYPEMDQEEPPTGRSQTKYVPSIMSETPIGRSQTKYEPSIMSETPIEYEPSIKSGTPITHGEKDNIELLGEVYHLVQGGALTQDFSILTQTRTPVLGNTMLHIAARYGRNEIVDRVANQAPKLLFMRNKNNDTALHVAARAGHIPTVKKLLEAYNNFQRPEIVKEWAEFMHWNQSHGFNEENYVSGLIDLMKLKNEQGNNVLHEAMMSKEANNIFQVFEPYVAENRQRESLSGSCYKAALNITNKANQSVLYLAVEAGHKETVILILDKCPHNVKPKGISPLVPAIMNRDQDMLTAILDKKQEWIHVKDTHGRLPLHYAASTSYHEGVVHLLNKCKSCSNQKDKHGFFPLHLASHGGNVEVVKELLKYCPDPTEMLDECGRNILHIAAKGGKYEVVLYILLTPQLEGMINQKDKDGNTPLHLASKWCHPKIVYALTWDDRVNVSLINHRTETALDIVNGVLQSQKEKPSLRQRLTWTALRSAGAKPRPTKVFHAVESSANNSKLNEANVEQISKESHSNAEPYKDMVETLLLVSTLIVTASVAACLAVPGKANGAAYNLHHAMFHFFIFSITVSLFSSITATIILFWTRLGSVQLLVHALNLVMPLLGVALISLSLAFMAGLYTVISKLSWLATSFLIITIIFSVGVFFLFILIIPPSPSTSKTLRYISYYPFILLASFGRICRNTCNLSSSSL